MSTTQAPTPHTSDDHAALLFEHTVSVSPDMSAQMRLATAAFSDALAGGRFCTFIADRTAPESLRQSLLASGADVARAEREERLTFLSAADTYMRDAHFEPQRMIDILAEAAEAAERTGCGPMFAAGELTWLGDPVPGSDRVLEYEYLINEVDELHRCGIFCVYDGASLPCSVATDLAAIHPSIHSAAGIVANPEFSTDGDLASSVRIADELEPPINGAACRQIAAIASARVDGELSAERRAQFDHHVASCPQCARAVRDAGDTKAALRGLRRQVDAPFGFMDALRDRIASDS